MKRSLSFLVLILIVVGLVVGLIAMNSSKDTRRKAAGESITINLSPIDGTKVTSAVVGGTLPVVVKVSTTGTQTVGMINMRVRFTKSLLEIVNDADVVKNSLFNGAIGSITRNNDNGYVDVLATAGGDEISGALVNLFTINFRIKGLGAATIEVDKDFDQSLIGGASGQYNLPADVTAAYTLGGSDTTPNPTNTTAPPTSTSVPSASPTPTLTSEEVCEGTANGGTWRMYSNGCVDNCSLITNPGQQCTQATTWGCDCGATKCWSSALKKCMDNPTITSTPSPTGTANVNPPICTNTTISLGEGTVPYTVTLHGSGNAGSGPGLVGYRWDFENDGTWDTQTSIDPVTHTYSSIGVYKPKYQILGSNNIWSAVCNYPFDVIVKEAPQITPTSTVIPTATPTNPPGATTLSFRMSMAGVRNYSRCLSDNTVDLILLSGESRKEYNGVALTDTGETTSNGLKIFSISNFNVSDFNRTSNVAVFVKGKKHLQTKYGVNGQTEFYNRAGGELNLDGSTVFDFTNYPLLAGDINKDGTVDAVDFTEVKSRAAAFEEIGSGGTNQYDLDGSCVVNNSDIILLIQALNEKYDQVY